MNITGSFTEFSLDLAAYREAVAKRLEQLVKDGAREAVQTMAVHVPVDTGMSRSSLNPVARAVGASIGNTKGRRRPDKTAEKGESQQTFGFFSSKFRFTIVFSTRVFQYVLNDTFGPTPPGAQEGRPWNSFGRGTIAFIDYVASNALGELPPIRVFVRRSVKRIG